MLLVEMSLGFLTHLVLPSRPRRGKLLSDVGSTTAGSSQPASVSYISLVGTDTAGGTLAHLEMFFGFLTHLVLPSKPRRGELWSVVGSTTAGSSQPASVSSVSLVGTDAAG